MNTVPITKLAIFGTAGWAAEAADIADACGIADVVFLAEPRAARSDDMSETIVPESEVGRLVTEGYGFAIGVANGAIRKKIAERYSALNFPNLVHPKAALGRGIAENLNEKRGNLIHAGVCLTRRTRFGDFGLFHMNATLGHDGDVGDFVSLMPGANVAGWVRLGHRVFIGSNACVINGTRKAPLLIGEGCMVGAGAAVTMDLPANVLAVGVPARVIKSL